MKWKNKYLWYGVGFIIILLFSFMGDYSDVSNQRVETETAEFQFEENPQIEEDSLLPNSVESVLSLIINFVYTLLGMLGIATVSLLFLKFSGLSLVPESEDDENDDEEKEHGSRIVTSVMDQYEARKPIKGTKKKNGTRRNTK